MGAKSWSEDLTRKDGPNDGMCHGNEPSGYIKQGYFVMSTVGINVSRKVLYHAVVVIYAID